MVMKRVVGIWILVAAMVMGGALPPQVTGENAFTTQWCVQAKSKNKSKKQRKSKKDNKKKGKKKASRNSKPVTQKIVQKRGNKLIILYIIII